MATIIRVAILCAAALIWVPWPASACTCAMRSATVAFWEVDRVFTGRAEVTPLGPGAQRARFRIEESFRGPGGVVAIVARGIGGSCAYAFEHGTRYLVFARRARDGTWRAFFCDPTAPLNQAREALDYARRMSGKSSPEDAEPPLRGSSAEGSIGAVVNRQTPRVERTRQ